MILPTQIQSKKFYSEDVYQLFSHLIAIGSFAPGKKLRYVELGKELGVSRTPIREAVRRLIREGLVVSSANRYTAVCTLDVADFDGAFRVLKLLEPVAVGEAVRRMSNEDMDLLLKMSALADNRQDPSSASEQRRAFFRILRSLGQDAHIARAIAPARAIYERFEYLARQSEKGQLISCSEIFNAITQGSEVAIEERYRAAMEKRYRLIREAFLAQQSDPV